VCFRKYWGKMSTGIESMPIVAFTLAIVLELIGQTSDVDTGFSPVRNWQG